MVKIDIRIWENKERMQERIRNLATIVMSITAVNGFFAYSEKNWIILGINGLFFIFMIPVFISWTKYKKDPPIQEDEN